MTDLDSYTNYAILGRGGYGVVLKAKTSDKRNVAIKIMKGNSKTATRETTIEKFKYKPENLVTYTKVWYQYSTGNGIIAELIVPLLKLTDEERFFAIEMELCWGMSICIISIVITLSLKGDLDSMIETCNRTTIQPIEQNWNSMATFIRHVTNGLEFLHGMEMVHRDMKPHNILYDGTFWKIADFGLSRYVDIDMTSQTNGTPLWKAPEQEGQSSYDWRVDIYALALILFEMIYPRSGRDRQDLLRDVRKHAVKDNVSEFVSATSGMRPWFKLIGQMMQTNPDNRPRLDEVRIMALNIANRDQSNYDADYGLLVNHNYCLKEVKKKREESRRIVEKSNSAVQCQLPKDDDSDSGDSDDCGGDDSDDDRPNLVDAIKRSSIQLFHSVKDSDAAAIVKGLLFEDKNVKAAKIVADIGKGLAGILKKE